MNARTWTDRPTVTKTLALVGALALAALPAACGGDGADGGTADGEAAALGGTVRRGPCPPCPAGRTTAS